jgi:hypothetical protein
MRTIQLEPVEGASKGIDKRQRKLGDENTNFHEFSQQLKKAQHAIAELYQENRELRRHMAERTIETLVSQSQACQLPPTSPTSRGGNVNWLKNNSERHNT